MYRLANSRGVVVIMGVFFLALLVFFEGALALGHDEDTSIHTGRLVEAVRHAKSSALLVDNDIRLFKGMV